MNRIDYCPCCFGKDFYSRDAITAPFIASYVLNEKISLGKLLRCKTCDLIFFNTRFTDDESKILYGHYRQEEYFNERHKHEFWYTREVNDFCEDPVVRRDAIFSFIKDVGINFSEINTILDYGGDKGQFFHECFANAEKYVYDLSDCEQTSGVTKIEKLTEEMSESFQFTMMCHLLEHLSEPSELLMRLHKYITLNGYLYIEVPSEQFKFKQIDSDFHRNYLTYMANSPRLFTLFDVASLFFRLKMGILPVFGVIKIHEHINFYSIRSLEHLLIRCGYEVVKISEEVVGVQKSGRNKIIQCLARKT